MKSVFLSQKAKTGSGGGPLEDYSKCVLTEKQNSDKVLLLQISLQCVFYRDSVLKRVVSHSQRIF